MTVKAASMARRARQLSDYDGDTDRVVRPGLDRFHNLKTHHRRPR